MQLSTLSNPYQSRPPSSSIPRRKLVREEIELRDRPESEISPLWKIVTVSSYFLVVTGGIITSITIGTLLAVFSNRCILYGRITVKGLDEILASGGNLTLYDENIVYEDYGELGDCTFCQYWSVASTIFGGVWGILFLQCGKGGISRRNSSVAWIIVPPALLVDIVFFIVACIIFGTTTGGLSFFCNHLRAENEAGEPSLNVTSCKQIMAFTFPEDTYNTDLYLNYVLAQMGSFLTFFGWLITLFLVIIRCFIPVDFVVYGRRLYEINIVADQDKNSELTSSRQFRRSQRRRQMFANNRGSALDEEELASTSTSIEVITTASDDCEAGSSSGIATTSFCSSPVKKFS